METADFRRGSVADEMQSVLSYRLGVMRVDVSISLAFCGGRGKTFWFGDGFSRCG